jgi:hypothetical protein
MVGGKPFRMELRKAVARHQWLTSVILAAQEAEIRRISV